MDLSSALLAEHSQSQAQYIADYVGNSPERFAQLVDIMLGEDALLRQRSAWVLSKICDAHPQLLQPHLRPLLDALQGREDLHPAVLRNSLRSLVGQPIPEDQQGEWFGYCLAVVQNPQYPVAIRVHAMQIAFELSQPYPELQQELRMVLETNSPEGSAGFRSRASKLLARLMARAS